MFAVLWILALHTTGKGLGGVRGKVERRRSFPLFPLPPCKKGESRASFRRWCLLGRSRMKALCDHDRNAMAPAQLHWRDCWLSIAWAGGVIVRVVLLLPWEWPYADEIIQELAPSAIKQVLFACPRSLQRPLLQPSWAPCLQWNAANINKRSVYIFLSSSHRQNTIFITFSGKTIH